MSETLAEMPTNKLVVDRINKASGRDSILSREMLISIFNDINPGISDTAIRNRIYNYIRKGILAQVSSKHFSVVVRENWNPATGKDLDEVWKILSGEYRENYFCLWSTKWLNDFVNLQAFNEILFVEAEEIIAQSVYFRLAEEKNNVFFAPDKKEIDFYVAGKEHGVALDHSDKFGCFQ